MVFTMPGAFLQASVILLPLCLFSQHSERKEPSQYLSAKAYSTCLIFDYRSNVTALRQDLG